MYVYVFMYICMCIYIYVYVCVRTYVCMYADKQLKPADRNGLYAEISNSITTAISNSITTARQGIPPSLLDNNVVSRLYLSWGHPASNLTGTAGSSPGTKAAGV